MWHSPYPRHTQRARLRRMGAFACLMAVLLIGFVLGRGSRGQEVADQIFLNDAPGSPSPTAPPKAGRAGSVDQRVPLGRVARPSEIVRTPQVRRTPRPSVSPRNSIDGSNGDEEPRYILRGEGDEDSGPPALSGLESEAVRLINAARKRAGCAPFRVDARLVQAARTHSAEMAATGRLSHESPDGSSPWDRMEAAGYRDGGAENIGRGSTTAADAVQSWMASSGHRRNILNCALTVTGVGVVDGPAGPWWTQDFGYS
ncbi:hypothetical protein Psi01_00400 [Planobispora siamensis]|uniref:SCP domain-containing protein n=2 Tax=Planobispora siamensis TaxID=936338 RepID=A0A8J3SB71_9ACTN|nr:hypothetical protein Psi01_00400 [Planobispora siamensis]